MSDEQNHDTEHHEDAALAANAATPAGETASPAGAPPAGQSGPAAVVATPEMPKPESRFRIVATDTSGPVKSYPGVTIDDDGVGRAELPAIAWHCNCEGYDVFDALRADGGKYDGVMPKGKDLKTPAEPPAEKKPDEVPAQA